MSNEPTPPHGAMEGKGAYNRHAKLPAGGAAMAVPLLEKAVWSVELDGGDQPVAIADYGSSQVSMLTAKNKVKEWLGQLSAPVGQSVGRSNRFERFQR